MKRTIIIILTLIWIGLLSAEWIYLNDSREKLEQPQFNVVDQRSNVLEISFELPGFKKENITYNSEVYTKISSPGSGEFLAIGKPDLPRFSKLIQIPSTGNVSIEIMDKKRSVIQDLLIYPRQQLQSESKREAIPFTIDNEYYTSNEMFPGSYCNVSDPAIMRDLRVVTLTINPFRYDPAAKQLEIIEAMTIRVNFDNEEGNNTKLSNRKQSRSFAEMYNALVLNYDETRDDYQKPSYLFVHPENDDIAPYLNELVKWKKDKGFEVNLVSVDDAGSTLQNIKSYVQDAYENWENPPEFLCLVGDANGPFAVPTGHYSQGNYDGEGDHYYTMLEGDDYLSDISVGRLSFNTLNEFATIISKILNYEKMPYTTTTDWYNEILLVGDPSDSGPSCVDTKLYVGQKMQQFNPNYNLNEIYLGNWVTNIASNLNEGVLYFNYRGFANMSGWSISNISALNNGYMLPVAVAITCQTGNFEASQDCISERFLKAGTPTVPKGAIAAISTATGNTHTCFNNSMDSGIFEGIFVDNIFNMGGALNMGKLNLHLNYPENPHSYVEKFSYWNNLMGDPGMELWTTVPEELSVSYEENVSSGTNYLDVLVGNNAGEPLEDAWITARSYNDDILSSAYSNINGFAQLDIRSDYEGPVSIVVTKHDFIPHLGYFNIEPAPSFVSVESFDFNETNGNFDGVINAGETIDFFIDLENHGSSSTGDITVTLESSLNEVSIDVDELSYNSIAAGDVAGPINPAVLNFDASIPSGTEVLLTVNIQAGTDTWVDYIYLEVAGPFLQLDNYTIIDNDDAILDPGETADLQIQISNIGSNNLNNLVFTLETDAQNIDILDNSVELSGISAGQIINVSDVFEIEAELLAVPGNQIPMNLTITSSEGYQQEIMFLLELGIVAVTHPLGPDNYGHYIYDDDDVLYINTMPYNWIEIDPENGGPGEVINIGDVGNMGSVVHRELPFPVTFYGVSYDSLTICTNGWIAPGVTNNQSFMNWMIPGAPGPSPIIAVFWDDLLMGEVDGSGQYVPNGSSICYYYDQNEHYLVVQWSGLQNEYDLSEEIFQCLIYDQQYYPSNTGDNIIKMQYHTINNVDQGDYENFFVNHGMYATVGIENHLSDDGIQYTYNNEYPTAAKELESETALTISGAPINSESAYLVVNALNTIDNDNDGFLENGEEIELYISLTNLGVINATNVTAEIINEDDYLIVNEREVTYQDIEGNATSINVDPFELTLAENAPQGYSAYFQLLISCDTDAWDVYLHLDLSGPMPHVDNFKIEDTNNHILDPGETSMLSFEITNDGEAPAIGMEMVLNSLNDHIVLENTNISIPDLDPGESYGTEIAISADDEIEMSSHFDIQWSINNDQGYDFLGEYTMYISQYPLQFFEEFNEFPPPGWTIDGDNWILNYSNYAGGSFPEMTFWGGNNEFDGTQQIITPPLNTLGSNQLRLRFKHTIEASAEGFIWGVKVSTDMENWNTLYETQGITFYYLNEEIILNAPQIGSESLFVSIYLIGSSETVYLWFIDDVEISYIPFEPHAFILGNVSFNNGDTDMNDVVISAGDFFTVPDDNGDYILGVQPGIYDVKAFKPGYIASISEDVAIDGLWSETSINFELDEIENDYIPENFAVETEISLAHLSWDIPGYNGENSRDEELQVNLNDDKNSRDLTSYLIYRNQQVIAEISDISQTTYEDGPLAEDTYTYYIAAIYDDSVEAVSDFVEIEITLPTPQNLVVTTTPSGNNVILNWQSPNDLVTGYRVYCDGEMISQQQTTYYIDTSVPEGTYIYGVSALYGGVESSLVEQEIDVTDSEDLIPQRTELLGNFPNPFNPVTSIRFTLSETAKIKIDVFNAKGRHVKTLINDHLIPASYSFDWNGQDDYGNQVGSGVYLYRMQLNGSNFATRKMILMK